MRNGFRGYKEDELFRKSALTDTVQMHIYPQLHSTPMLRHRSKPTSREVLVSEVSSLWCRVIGSAITGFATLSYQGMTFADNPAPQRSRFRH